MLRWSQRLTEPAFATRPPYPHPRSTRHRPRGRQHLADAAGAPGCETVCDTNLDRRAVSEPLRYRAPPRCHRLSLPMLLRARHARGRHGRAARERVLGLPSRCPLSRTRVADPHVPTTRAAAARWRATIGAPSWAAAPGRRLQRRHRRRVRRGRAHQRRADRRRCRLRRGPDRRCVAACWPTNNLALPMHRPRFDWPGAVWRGELEDNAWPWATARCGASPRATRCARTTKAGAGARRACLRSPSPCRCATSRLTSTACCRRVHGTWLVRALLPRAQRDGPRRRHRYLAKAALALHCAGRIRLLS